MCEPVTVLISSRNRPLYLWACLDALYRGTREPCRFVLADMGSTDPLVAAIIEGFERRGMFAEVLRFGRNDPTLLADLIFRSLGDWSPLFAYVESDVVVEATTPCWLARMIALMQANPTLAMLGSAVDQRDFVRPEDVEALRGDRGEAEWRALIKADSPERLQDVASAAGSALFQPHNPAGRLLMLRAKAIERVGIAGDAALDRMLREHGFETAVATEVRHRHLSLVQVFDYPGYDLAARDRYMSGHHRPQAPDAAAPASFCRAADMDEDPHGWFAGKSFTTDWTTSKLSIWTSTFADRRPAVRDILEIGAWEGRSAVFFLRFFASAHLTAIDTFAGSTRYEMDAFWTAAAAGSEAHFDANLAEFAGRCRKVKSTSHDALARLAIEAKTFDLIYVDGSHHSLDVYADACMALPILRSGGHLVFDDYTWTGVAGAENQPKTGIDAFLAAMGGLFVERYRGLQVIIEKV